MLFLDISGFCFIDIFTYAAEKKSGKSHGD